jgi:hypothetical protein
VTPKRRRRLAVELDRAQHQRNKKYGRRWQQISDQVLREAGYRCQIKLPGICTGHADVCDHIDESGPSTRENAQAACRRCNQAKAYFRRLEEAKAERGWPSAAELDGRCASVEGGPHDLTRWGGPRQCWGAAGHASRDW